MPRVKSEAFFIPLLALHKVDKMMSRKDAFAERCRSAKPLPKARLAASRRVGAKALREIKLIVQRQDGICIIYGRVRVQIASQSK